MVTKIRFYFFLIIPLILLTLYPAVSLADADRIFKENNKAVVVVVTYDKDGKVLSQGSGFIVRQDGAVVTNYHIISDAIDIIDIKVKAVDKVLSVEGLLHMDKENDIVILKAKGVNLQSVKIGDIEKLAVGEKVYVISSPEGLENTISEGILSGVREIDPKRKILQITAPVSSGSSGGPVFNKDGEVIGIVTFLIKEAQNLNFSMPVNLIKDKIVAKKVIALKDTEVEDYKKSAEYWFVVGYYYSESGMHREAIEAYKQAIKQAIRIKPDYAEAHYALGLAYLLLNDRGSALEQYKILKDLDPEWANELFNLIYNK